MWNVFIVFNTLYTLLLFELYINVFVSNVFWKIPNTRTEKLFNNKYLV